MLEENKTVSIRFGGTTGTLAIMFGTMIWSHTMKAGDLIKLKRARIGMSVGTLGIIVGEVENAPTWASFEKGREGNNVRLFDVVMFRNGKMGVWCMVDNSLELHDESG
jgi:hypothetical protein